jgi:hypothetical protein
MKTHLLMRDHRGLARLAIAMCGRSIRRAECVPDRAAFAQVADGQRCRTCERILAQTRATQP